MYCNQDCIELCTTFVSNVGWFAWDGILICDSHGMVYCFCCSHGIMYYFCDSHGLVYYFCDSHGMVYYCCDSHVVV